MTKRSTIHASGAGSLAALLALAVALTVGCSRLAAPRPERLDAKESVVVSEDTLPLASWENRKARRAILDFVQRVTTPGPDFVPEPDRIAVFDNDGTLWAEKPIYFQFAFAIDRVSVIASQHPDWNAVEPFASILAGDHKGALAGGKQAMLEVLGATHAGITLDEYEAAVRQWISTARHPTSGRLYKQMTYQPMLEVLEYLRAHGFKTFIVSGGGVDFMRVYTDDLYGIPPEQVVGSLGKVTFENRSSGPVLLKHPEFVFIDDKKGKPVGIHNFIGRRPIAAFGNSDGDLPMLQWTCSRKGPSFCLYVHHTDGEREFAYDRKTSIGRLDEGLDQARRDGWTVADMKQDWKVVFAPLP